MWQQLLVLTLAAGPHNQLAQSPVWDQGNAELCLYRVEGRAEGAPRSYEAVSVVVKEPWDMERMVKAGADTRRSVDVFKFNFEVTIPTGLYSWRQMASVFYQRSSMAPLKLTTTSQELCGITTKHWRSDRPGVLHTHSYFDGQGDQDFELAVEPPPHPYEALPWLVRTLRPSETGAELRLLSPQLSSRASPPRLLKARVDWGEQEQLETPVGSFEVRRLVVRHELGEDVLWLQRDTPHLMVAWDAHDGTRYRLHNAVRLPYWSYTSEGDRKLLSEPDPVRQQAIP